MYNMQAYKPISMQDMLAECHVSVDGYMLVTDHVWLQYSLVK